MTPSLALTDQIPKGYEQKPAWASGILVLGSLVTFAIDLTTHFFFSPWVLYSLLPFFVPRLLAHHTIIWLGTSWTFLIVAAGLYTQTDEHLLLGWLNRSLGICVLWYLLVLLHHTKHAEAVKRGDEERFRTVLHSALDAVISIDESDSVTEWNPQAETIFGIPRAEAIGRPLSRLIIPDRYREAHACGMARYRKTGEGPILNRRIEIVAVHRDGHEFPVELTVMPFCHGDAYSFTAFARDITERKRAEQAQLDARQAAESANRAKSDLLANVSHELRTPLNALLGMADLLLESPLSPEQRRYTDVTRRSGLVLLSLVNELLDLGKIESGTLQLIQEPFDLDDLVTRVLGLLSEAATKKGLVLRYQMSGDTPTRMIGDPGRVQQILINLLGNAIKFTPAGEVCLKVSCLDMTPQSATLQFQVSDTGIGIPADKLGMVFDRFTQVDASSSRQHGGVGLGLSICRQLAGLMGGTLTVESLQGQGSTFTLTVRLGRHRSEPATPGIAPSRADADASRPSPEEPSRRSLRILLAEDFEDGQELIRFYLKGTPHRLDIVEDGECAVGRAQAHSYDIILMDIQMPAMDGYQATHTIREWEREQGRTRTPIIALTANALKQHGERAEASGFTAFVTKPISKTTLMDVLDRYAAPSAASTTQGTAGFTSGEASSAQVGAAIDQLRGRFFLKRREDVARLHAALAAQDFAAIQRIGHQIKGLAGSFGYDDVGRWAAVLEQTALDHDLSALARTLTEFEAAITRAEGHRELAA